MIVEDIKPFYLCPVVRAGAIVHFGKFIGTNSESVLFSQQFVLLTR